MDAKGTKELIQTAGDCSTVFQLVDLIRETAFAIHKYHRNGHFEKVYENALINRLRKQGIKIEQQIRLSVRDEDGTIIGDYLADLFVEDFIILELKVCKALTDDHIGQALGYLRATGLEHAMLINFGAPKLQVKKIILSQRGHTPQIEDQ